MRKTALKKMYPNRHRIIKTLRERNYLQEIVTRTGRSVCLNFMKHFLYARPYINEEFQKEMLRRMRKQKRGDTDGH